MISKRIKAIAKYTKDSYKVTDIGCDHGYLIVDALKNYNVSHAVAVDNKELPLSFAKANINKEGLTSKVRFSLSNGLEDLEKDSDTIVIAGLGGSLIALIIDAGLDKIYNQKLILQANRNNYELRKYLNLKGFKFLDEEIIYDGFYYQIIVVRKENYNYPLTESELLYGPINIKKRSQLLIKMLKSEEKRWIKIPDSNELKIQRLEIIRRILNEN